MNASRVPALSAAGAALVYVAMLFATQPEGPEVETASVDQIRKFYESNATAIQVSALSLAIAGVAIVIFAVALAAQLPSGTGTTQQLLVAASVLIAVWHWLTAAVESSTAVQALDGTKLSDVGDDTIRAWYATTNVTHRYGDIAMFAIALFLFTAGAGVLRAGLLPRWIGILGIVAALFGAAGAIGCLIALPALAFAFFGGLFGWALWLLVVAVALLLRARKPAIVAAHVSL